MKLHVNLEIFVWQRHEYKEFLSFEVDNLEGYGLLSHWTSVTYLTHQSCPNIKLPINTQPPQMLFWTGLNILLITSLTNELNKIFTKFYFVFAQESWFYVFRNSIFTPSHVLLTILGFAFWARVFWILTINSISRSITLTRLLQVNSTGICVIKDY